MTLKTIPRAAVAVAAAAAIAAALVSCSSDSSENAESAQEVYDRFAGMSGDERHDALVEAAQEEGDLVVYTQNSYVESLLVPAFEEEYGINVTVFRATVEELRQRVLQEADANRIQNDIIESIGSEMPIFAEEADLISPYESDLTADIPEEAKTPYFTAAYYVAELPVANRDLVPEDQLPDNYPAYADPEWAGKLAIDQGDVFWYNNLYRYFTETEGYSDDEFADMMKAIAANSRTVNGHVSNTELLSAGDFSVFLSNYLQYVPTDGSGPLIFRDIAPVGLQLVGPALMKEASHPAAAVLWIDFYMTQAQAILNDRGYIPANPSQISDYEPRLPEGTEFIYDDWEMLSSPEAKEWQQAFENLLTGQDPVLPE